MAKKRISWRGFQNVLSAVAAFLTAVTGLYVALRPGSDAASAPDPTLVHASNISAKVPSNPQPIGNTYLRTPWLGVELYQQDRAIEMRSRDEDWCEFEANLDSGPFELRFTRSADDPGIGVLAWHDESIFDLVENENYMLPGTGIAGARFATPILYLDNEGFNYYDTGRMNYLGGDKYSIFVSTIGTGRIEIPLPRFSGPIYLVVFRDSEQFTMEVPRRSYEFLTLHR